MLSILTDIVRRLLQSPFNIPLNVYEDVTDEEVERAIYAVPTHYAGMSSLIASMGTEFKWTAQNNLTGAAYNPTQNTGDIRKTQGAATTSGNTQSGGADEVFSFQQPLVAGGSATLDLSAMTNLLGQATVGIARIKGVQFRLLSAVDDSTITPAPNASSAVLVTNNGPAVPCQLNYGNGGSGLTITITVTGSAIATVAIGAVGSGYPPSTTFPVTVNQATGSGGVINVTTNGSGVPTAVAMAAAGTGYTAATLPTTVLGHRYILTGGADMYVDPNANGFCTVDTTHKNVKIVNLDGANAITVEVDIMAATT